MNVNIWISVDLTHDFYNMEGVRSAQLITSVIYAYFRTYLSSQDISRDRISCYVT